MPLQLAFSSNAYLDVPVEEAVARIAGAGYRGIELLADVPHAWPATSFKRHPTSCR
jgi:sugar phosphate isomerase/epimerase